MYKEDHKTKNHQQSEEKKSLYFCNSIKILEMVEGVVFMEEIKIF